jgi:hypothetical protein
MAMIHRPWCSCPECRIERKIDREMLRAFAKEAELTTRPRANESEGEILDGLRTFVRMFEEGDATFLGHRTVSEETAAEMHRLAALIEA